jgi:hypothetical protein
MAIRYVLHVNPFKKDEETYIARIRSVATLDLDQIIKAGLNRGGWPAHPAQVKAILTRYGELAPELLAEGYRLITPIAELWLVVEGEFKNERERVNLKKHKLKVASSVRADITRIVRRTARFEKEHGRVRRPYLDSVYDGLSRTYDSALTRGGTVTVTGAYLKFDPKDDNQGVFLRGNGPEYRIANNKVIANKPKSLLLLIPNDLPLGEYSMCVRAKVRHTSVIREGHFSRQLCVVEHEANDGKA